MRLITISVAMIPTTAQGSLLRYGMRVWYADALFDTALKNESLVVGALLFLRGGVVKSAILNIMPRVTISKYIDDGGIRVEESSTPLIRVWGPTALAGAIGSGHCFYHGMDSMRSGVGNCHISLVLRGSCMLRCQIISRHLPSCNCR